jgi:hypothetical protein
MTSRPRLFSHSDLIGPLMRVRTLLISIVVAGLVLAFLRHFSPVGSSTAIEIAVKHAHEVYPGIDLDGYSINVPSRADWCEEWAVNFHHRSTDSGFLVVVTGGDFWNGPKVRVYVDNEWGAHP